MPVVTSASLLQPRHTQARRLLACCFQSLSRRVCAAPVPDDGCPGLVPLGGATLVNRWPTPGARSVWLGETHGASTLRPPPICRTGSPPACNCSAWDLITPGIPWLFTGVRQPVNALSKRAPRAGAMSYERIHRARHSHPAGRASRQVRATAATAGD